MSNIHKDVTNMDVNLSDDFQTKTLSPTNILEEDIKITVPDDYKSSNWDLYVSNIDNSLQVPSNKISYNNSPTKSLLNYILENIKKMKEFQNIQNVVHGFTDDNQMIIFNKKIRNITMEIEIQLQKGKLQIIGSFDELFFQGYVSIPVNEIITKKSIFESVKTVLLNFHKQCEIHWALV